MSFRKEKYEGWIEDADECKRHFEFIVKKGVITRLEDPQTWSKRHLEKADHNLDFATLINDVHKTIIKERFPDKTFHDWTTIAYYYSIYHAALALLAQAGYKSKSHMATLCGVILHYYHNERTLEKKHIDILKKIDKENIDQFIEAQSLRERASYGVSVSFEERLSAMAKKDAIDFVEKSKEILEGGK